MEKTSLYLFSDVLRTFRKSRHLSQQELASRLHKHRQTIGNWERGNDLPNNRTMVLEIGRALGLNEQEILQLLEASFTAPTPLWYLPYPRNPLFTGREEALASLHQLLTTNRTVALTQSYALHGLGGIGKTQLAIEYAYRHALEYHAVFWVSAESAQEITNSFVAIAEVLQLPERLSPEQQQIIAAVQRWLATHGDWLLIWDNLEDLDLLCRFLPGVCHGLVLITTRAQALGTLAQGVEVLSLPVEEALLFLLRRAKLLQEPALSRHLAQWTEQEPAECEAAKTLVHLLNGIPLALDQAGAYIEETGCRVSDYLNLYQNRRGELLARRGTQEGGHPHSVLTTFALANQRLASEQPATDLMRVCSFLAADAIPEELFNGQVPGLGPALQGILGDPLGLNHALAALRRLSLVQRQAQTRTLSLHRLVQSVQQEMLGENGQRQWAEVAVRLVARAFPDASDFANWKQLQRLLPHALVCATHIMERWSFTFLEGAQLLNDIGHYFRLNGQNQAALPFHERALAIREQALGLEHPDVALSLNNVGVCYYVLRQHAEALPFFLRALQVREQALGPNHPDVAKSLNNLALLYCFMGRYEDAVPLYQRTLEIFEQVLGPDHPHVGTSLNNLADTYREMGNTEEALPVYLRSLNIREQALGADNPDVAISLTGVGSILEDMGNYQEALLYHQRALKIREQGYGPIHPDTALSLCCIATALQHIGQYEEALPLHERALTIRTEQLGPDHPDTAQSLARFAEWYQAQNRLSEALALSQQALAILEQRLGSEHPETIKTRIRFAALLPSFPQELGVRRNG